MPSKRSKRVAAVATALEVKGISMSAITPLGQFNMLTQAYDLDLNVQNPVTIIHSLRSNTILVSWCLLESASALPWFTFPDENSITVQQDSLNPGKIRLYLAVAPTNQGT